MRGPGLSQESDNPVQLQITETVLRYNLNRERRDDDRDDFADDRNFVNCPGGNKWITPFSDDEDEDDETPNVLLDPDDTETDEIDPEDPPLMHRGRRVGRDH